MDNQSQLILREKEPYLRKNLPIDQILPRLYQRYLITDDERERIEKEATTMDRVTKCLRIIKQKKGGYTKFLKVLKEEECEYIVAELESTVIPEEHSSTERPRDDIQTSATEPSTGGVKVTIGPQTTVRTYRNRNGTTHTILADAGDTTVKLMVYDRSKIAQLQPEQTVFIRDFSSKGNTWYVTSKTRVYPAGDRKRPRAEESSGPSTSSYKIMKFSHEDWNFSRCPYDAQSTSDDTRAKVLSISALSTYKSCINPGCFRVGLYRNRCESCGFYYNHRIQCGTSAKGKIKLQMKGNTEYFTIFTQQLEQLCDITGVEMNLLNIRTVQMQLNRRMPITVKCYTRGKNVSSFQVL